MTVWQALAGGFVGTIVMTTAMRLASQFDLTRTDIAFLLGTAVTARRERAQAIGYVLHFATGLASSLVYLAVFRALGSAGWLLGGALGLLHGLFSMTVLLGLLLPAVHPRMGSRYTAADRSPVVEPPGRLMLNYGPSTPVVTTICFIAYGAIIGAFVGS